MENLFLFDTHLTVCEKSELVSLRLTKLKQRFFSVSKSFGFGDLCRTSTSWTHDVQVSHHVVLSWTVQSVGRLVVLRVRLVEEFNLKPKLKSNKEQLATS